MIMLASMEDAACSKYILDVELPSGACKRHDKENVIISHPACATLLPGRAATIMQFVRRV